MFVYLQYKVSCAFSQSVRSKACLRLPLRVIHESRDTASKGKAYEV